MHQTADIIMQCVSTSVHVSTSACCEFTSRFQTFMQTKQILHRPTSTFQMNVRTTVKHHASSSCNRTATDAKTHLCEGSSVFIVKFETIGEYTFARCILVYTGHE